MVSTHYVTARVVLVPKYHLVLTMVLIMLAHYGPFNNYVDKMKGGGGPKMSVFVHAQGIKTVHIVVECPLSIHIQ